MYTLKTPAFLRPTSRPTSPAPGTAASSHTDSAPPADRARPMSKLSFSNFKRTASPLTRPPSTQTLVHDGSYMEILSLKLSEAITKALAQPPGPGIPAELLGGRRPIPAGRGRVLGELIATEIKSTRENPHLYRAVLRTLHRPLSVLVTNLSGTLLPLIASPAFTVVPSPQSPNPNPTQLHALALATFAGELLETFDQLGLGQEGDMRGDGLKGARDSLVTTIKRVVEPLVSGVKNDLMPHIEDLEHLPPVAKAAGATKTAPAPVHPSLTYLQSVVPVYARALSRYITSTVAEGYLASLTISLVWRALVALAHRPAPPSSTTPPGSPPLGTKKRRGSSATPPTTPPPSRFTLKLPPSRPPSPGIPHKAATAASDARALFDLLGALPRPTAPLPREAAADALDALRAFGALLDLVRAPLPAAAELTEATRDVPVLVALPVLLRAAGVSATVSGILGLEEGAYRAGWLAGFGRAETGAARVGARVLGALRAMPLVGPEAHAVVRWLEGEVEEAVREEREAAGH